MSMAGITMRLGRSSPPMRPGVSRCSNVTVLLFELCIIGTIMVAMRDGRSWRPGAVVGRSRVNGPERAPRTGHWGPGWDERTRTGGTGDTKQRLMRAGEQLFAREGIHRVRVRQINELAGQRNPSALHYHFGSREGLVDAILGAHQSKVDAELDVRLDELEAAGGRLATRDVVEAIVHPLCRELDTPSGRDFLRIVPQILDQISANLRRGVRPPVTPQTSRVLRLLDDCMGDLPEPVRRERLVAYVVILTGLLAERAHHLEAEPRPILDASQFAAHLVDTIVAALSAPSSVRAATQVAGRD